MSSCLKVYGTVCISFATPNSGDSSPCPPVIYVHVCKLYMSSLYVHSAISKERYFLWGVTLNSDLCRVSYNILIADDTERRAVSLQHPTVLFAPTRITLVHFCKTVRPMLSDRCPVCPVCLSVTLVYCGLTVGWIKMKLGTEVGLGPGDIVLDGDPAPLKKGAHQPPFSAHVRCGQTAGWMLDAT